MPAYWCKSTIRSCRTFSRARAWTALRWQRRAEIYVEATNAALKGIAPERVRFHTCYGINEGPRLFEAALSDIIVYVLKINAGSYSFEAANRATSTSIICSKPSRCRTARCCAPA